VKLSIPDAKVIIMEKLTIRKTSADLPVFDEEAELRPVDVLGTDKGTISDFEYNDASLRALDLESATLLHGKVRAMKAERAKITDVRMDSVEFTGCDLSSLHWEGGKLSRVRFETCKLLGADFKSVSLDHVVFVGCKLDYATLDQVRATGPVLFVRCSLSEAEFTGCDLSNSLFDDCDLRLTVFGEGSYRGCDLRGNDLSTLSGTRHLKRVVIDRAQTVQLAEAVASELDVTFGDALPDQ
jgi:uncharacterized protein YjbI with pentapeptide repeats